MDLALLLKGLMIGFSIAAPVGPIGILCIRRTLANGQRAGLVSGLGAATADAVYGVVAGFGLTFISTFLVNQQGWIRIAGGLFMCYLGIRTMFSRPATTGAEARRDGLVGAYFSTLVLTLTNPMTILSFAAIFAGLGLGSTGGNYLSAGLLVAGVFGGSAAWWLALSGFVNLFRHRFNQQSLYWVNRFSGAVILVFGVIALFSLLGRS